MSEITVFYSVVFFHAKYFSQGNKKLKHAFYLRDKVGTDLIFNFFEDFGMYQLHLNFLLTDSQHEHT